MRPLATKEECTRQFEHWLAAARAGDNDALGAALDSVRELLFKLGSQYMIPSVSIRSSLSDLVQETYVQALKAFRHFLGNSRAEFVVWLAAIQVHLYRKMERAYLETAKRGRHREIHVSQGSWCAEFLADLPGTTPPPDVELETNEWWQALERAISRLSPREQVCVRWRLDATGPLEELAVLLDRPVRTLREMVSKARAKLADHFLHELAK